jgi:general nucleoside transport system ATP-binding protein
VWKELLRAREEGKAILLISAELEELLNLADRIAVMFEGRIVGTVAAAGASVEQIGSMMAGGASGKNAGATPAESGRIPEGQHGEAL